MARLFKEASDWAVGSVQLRGSSGFTAVLSRHDDAIGIWQWVCPHKDHSSPEAIACGQAQLLAASQAL